MNGIAYNDGTVPLITIQRTPEGIEALQKEGPLIKKFKKELLNGTFDLVKLVDSYRNFICCPHRPSVEDFYRKYNILVLTMAPIKALDILKNINQRQRRHAIRGTDEDRKKIMENILLI